MHACPNDLSGSVQVGTKPLGVREDGGVPGDGSDGLREAIARHLVTPLGRDYTKVYTDDGERHAGETIQGCVCQRRSLISVAA